MENKILSSKDKWEKFRRIFWRKVLNLRTSSSSRPSTRNSHDGTDSSPSWHEYHKTSTNIEHRYVSKGGVYIITVDIWIENRSWNENTGCEMEMKMLCFKMESKKRENVRTELWSANWRVEKRRSASFYYLEYRSNERMTRVFIEPFFNVQNLKRI